MSPDALGQLAIASFEMCRRPRRVPPRASPPPSSRAPAPRARRRGSPVVRPPRASRSRVPRDALRALASRSSAIASRSFASSRSRCNARTFSLSLVAMACLSKSPRLGARWPSRVREPPRARRRVPSRASPRADAPDLRNLGRGVEFRLSFVRHAPRVVALLETHGERRVALFERRVALFHRAFAFVRDAFAFARAALRRVRVSSRRRWHSRAADPPARVRGSRRVRPRRVARRLVVERRP